MTIDEIERGFNYVPFPPLNPQDTLSATIYLDGTIEFVGFLSVLLMSSNSQIILSPTGTITGNAIVDLINIGGNFVWGGGDGDITGPGVMDENTVGGVLPIELISFHTQLSGSAVEIEWATASELNNDFFTLERSENGGDWSIIGEVEGAGNSHIRLDYQFTDFDPIPGLSYYRLKQTDYDGQFEYFAPSAVLYEPDNLLSVYPNPVEQYLNITTVSDSKNAIIIINDLNGSRENVAISLVNGHQAQLEMGHLAAGVYILQIVFPESLLSSRIIKK